jgi:glycolate oxidase
MPAAASPSRVPPERTVRELAGNVDAEVIITDPDVMAGYVRDQAPRLPAGAPAAVVTPRTTAEVAAVVSVAALLGVPIVPRGGGSGLAGGANAIENCVVVSLHRMDSVVHIDAFEQLIVVQPGVITADVRRAAAAHQLWYAPDPSSHEISTIGGNVATNAGGLCCAKYGVTRDSVVSLEVVLPNAAVVRLGSTTRKGVVGYDLMGLLVGSEGTLGIVTEITLRLRPMPHPPSTIVAMFPTLAATARALALLRTSRAQPSLLEVMDRSTIRAVDDMLAMDLDRDAAAILLAQVDDAPPDQTRLADQISASFTTAGATEVYSTDDPEEGAQMLAARRAALTSLQRRGPVLLDDICVPLGAIDSALSNIEQIAERRGVHIATFGHAGDGNLHPTIALGHDDRSEAAAMAAFDDIITLAHALGGTASGEHGVGQLKRNQARHELGQQVIDMHHAIKLAIDPRGIMNPGRGF